MRLICTRHNCDPTRFQVSDPMVFYCQHCAVIEGANLFPMEAYPEISRLGVKEFLRQHKTQPSERLRTINDDRKCQNNDSLPAMAFGVSDEAEFYCTRCAQNRPTGEVFPMELYDCAKVLGFSEFVRRQKDSSNVKTFIQSLKTSEEEAHKQTKYMLKTLHNSLLDWITARNNIFNKWIREIEIENEEFSSGKIVSTDFQNMLTLIVSKEAESQVLHMLYDFKPLQDQLPRYQDFKESHISRQSESFAKQISELCRPQPIQQPSSPEPSNPRLTWYPLLSDSICMRWNLDAKQLRRVEVQGPKMLSSGTTGVVQVDNSSFFLCGCGVSKKETALVNLNTGTVEMYPDLKRERESCGLIFYQGFIYFFGGFGGSRYGLTRSLAITAPTLSVERLSLSTHQYQELADMINPRYGFNAARWRQKVYLAGGWNSGGRIDVYDLLTNSFTTLPEARAYDHISCACVVGEELVVFSRDTMRKWRINESGLGRMEERRLSTSVDDLWSNLTPINTIQGVICVNFSTFKLYTLNAATGDIREERLK